MNNNSLNSFLETRKNNFDIIRFFAAILVMYSHSYPLTMGNDKTEPLMLLTKNQTGFGHLAVTVFFIISGFLITQSFDRSKNFYSFFRARILRIYPALIVLLLLTVFVLGPLLTRVSLTEFFLNPETWKYLFLNISLIGMQYDLPGVFESNSFPISVNGSLWTLWFEFFFYLIVGLLGGLKLINKKVVLSLFMFCMILSYLYSYIEGPLLLNYFFKYINLFVYFSAGMLFYVFRHEVKLNSQLAILSFVILIIGIYLGNFDQFFPLFGAYTLFYISFQKKVVFSNFSKMGDFSYGIYIYAFPIQQTITFYFNNQLKPSDNFWIALPITLVFSIISWYLIEKQALKLKKKVPIKEGFKAV
ncbi:acyltransferase family protein [Bacillus cereus]|uniref:acyltransferase family protein n=1 Tax=Bacillus cereus TaxID=1396 RepID=UPI0024BD45FC|nr:acyltransferase [Bacillus cereus]